MADGSVAIHLDLNVDEAEKELARLKRQLDALADGLAEKRAKRTFLEKELAAARGQWEKLAGCARQTAGGLAGQKDAALLDQLAQKAARLCAEQQRLDEEAGAAEGRYQAALARCGALQKSGAAAAVQTRDAWEAATGAAAGCLQRVLVLCDAGETAAPAFARLGGMLQKALGAQIIARGLASIERAAAGYLRANGRLMAALGALKGALAAAFRPILDAALPALAALIRYVSRAVGAVARLIAVLFGRTAGRARAGAKGLEAQAEALGSVGEAADEAAASLAGFDEIERLDAEKARPGGSGSGGGGDGADGAGPAGGLDGGLVKSWGEAFAAFLDEAAAGAAKLRKTFARFAAWLNTLSRKLLAMFTFAGVKEKVERLGADLADAFDALVGSIDWALLGAALGAGLGLAVTLAVHFLSAFPWAGLGDGIARFINGAVGQIDWQDVGRLLWEGFTLGIRMLAGLLLGLDMQGLAQAASHIVTGFLGALTQCMLETDWTALIERVLRQVADLAAGVDYSGIATAAFTAMGAAFGAAVSTIIGLVSDAWDNVVEWWHDAAFEDGHFTVDGLLEGILDALKNIGGWVRDNVFAPFVGGFQKAFGLGAPGAAMAQMGGALMQGLLEGVQGKAAPLLEAVTQICHSVTGFVSGAFTGDWEQAWAGVKAIFKEAWNGVIALLEGAVNLIVRGINGLTGGIGAALSFDLPGFLGGGRVGLSLPQIAPLTIPRLAQGAVIPPNREFLAVLGDQATGTNVEAPLSTIQQAVRVELQGQVDAMMAGFEAVVAAIRDKQMDVYIGDGDIGRAAARYQDKMKFIKGGGY